jgi:hypothetical protein
LGSGRCVCPTGFENKGGKCVPVQQEVDACQLARVNSSSGETIPNPIGGSISLRPGTQLGVSFVSEAVTGSGFETLFVPRQGTETRPSTEAIVLSRSGSFALKLRKANSTQECSLIPKLEVKCDSGELEVAGRCQSCPESEGFWLDAKGSQCKKKPRIEVKAASKKLSIKHVKARRSEDGIKATVEVRLTSGDIDATPADRIAWLATSSAQWLRLGRTDGTVDSKDPVAEFAVLIDATGFRDTYNASASGQQPLFGTITVTSSMRDKRTDLFEDGTHSMALPVELTIEAAPVLRRDDVVVVQTADGAVLADGGSVTVGSSLLVRVNAMDYERLPINRPDLRLTLSLFSSDGRVAKRVSLLFVTGSTYVSEITGSWILDPGSFGLNVSSADSHFAIRFEAVRQDPKLIYLAAGLSVMAALLLVLAVFLVHRGHGSWKTRVTKVLMPILNVGNVALEVWDIYRQFAERRQLVEVPWLTQLYIPYTLFFGLACLASVVAILLKLKVFVGFVARMLGQANAALDHQQKLADTKKQMIALIVVGSLEDLPMGAPSICPVVALPELLRSSRCCRYHRRLL